MNTFKPKTIFCFVRFNSGKPSGRKVKRRANLRKERDFVVVVLMTSTLEGFQKVFSSSQNHNQLKIASTSFAVMLPNKKKFADKGWSFWMKR